jgi:hypothetical protein
MKETAESDKSASYRDGLLNIYPNGRQTTTLYDNIDDLNFAIITFFSM